MSNPDSVVYRQALPTDAAQISSLYNEEYCPPGCDDAREHYPFPQLLDPQWVASAVTWQDLCWFVAVADGAIVGSAAAVRNIGAPADQIAELFGIVVSRKQRNHGVGRGILSELVRELEESTQILLCESRTADPRAWKVARYCGFEPIGFEPFAHSTHAGSESMLMTAITRRASAQRDRRQVCATPSIAALSAAVSEESMESPLGVDGMPSVLSPAEEKAGKPPQERFQFSRADASGCGFLSLMRTERAHSRSVVCLERLEGEDNAGCRYARRYYVAERDGAVQSAARIVWDHSDRRARILELRSRESAAEPGLLEFLITDLRTSSPNSPTIVVDIEADAAAVALRLEKMQFSPTVYYPSLICNPEGKRIDAVQYTLPGARPFHDCLSEVAKVQWPKAMLVMKTVAEFARPTKWA